MPFFRSLVETAMDVLCERVRVGAVLGHHQGVLDPDPAVPGKVHTGLDGDDEAGGEDSSAQVADRGRLVDVEAHPVAGAVLEAVGPTGLGDDLPADVVDLLGPMPGRTAATPAACDVADDVEDAGQLALGFGADAERPRHVRAVPLEGGAEVDDDGIAPARCAGEPGSVVGLGRVLAGGDDRLEGGALRPAPTHGGVERQGELLLGHVLGPCSGSTS